MSEQEWDFTVWRRANQLLQQAERIHRNFLQIAATSQYREQHGRASSWQPPINVVETDENLWVMVALAGVATDKVDVQLEGSDLVIAGERRLPQCCNEGELKLWEIPFGHFDRRLRLVGWEYPLLLGEISFQDGLLTIQIRKQS
jgi:HSP20 family protein